MINSIKELFHNFSYMTSLRNKTKVRIGDLKLSSSADNEIYGDACPLTIDSDNKVCDGNHRIYKLLQENGPDHEIEVVKYKYPQWTALVAIAINAFFIWSNEKWQSIKGEIKKDLPSK